jgi:hypothetical protein
MLQGGQNVDQSVAVAAPSAERTDLLQGNKLVEQCAVEPTHENTGENGWRQNTVGIRLATLGFISHCPPKHGNEAGASPLLGYRE